MPAMTDHQKTENCSKHGEYKSHRYYNAGVFQWATSCPKCQEEIAAQKAAINEVQKQKRIEINKKNRIEARLRDSNIPERFAGANFDNYKTTIFNQKKALQGCRKYADEFTPGRSAVLCGTTGTGKTHLAAAIIKTVITQHDYAAMYIRTAALLREVKSTYNSSSRYTEDEIVKKYTTPELLVIDEIGVQYGTDTEKNILFEIINERYEQVKSTILISNLDIDHVEQFIGSRLVDRIWEGGGGMIIFDWESERKSA